MRSASFGGKTSRQSRYYTVPGGAEDPQFFFFFKRAAVSLIWWILRIFAYYAIAGTARSKRIGTMAYDLRKEEDVKEYLKNLHIEYQFGCHSEKKPEGECSLGPNLTV